MRLFLLAILLSISLITVYTCLPKGKSSKVTLGEDTYICIFIAPLQLNTTGKYLRLATTVKADKLTKIRVLNGWTSPTYSNDTVMREIGVLDDIVGAGSAITVSSMGVLSYQRIYRQTRLHEEVVTVNMTSTPSSQPSSQPSSSPSAQPSTQPTSEPTNPTSQPSSEPSSQPISRPSSQPSTQPTSQPSSQPILKPTGQPTSQPSTQPTTQPSTQPSSQPTTQPSSQPTQQPSSQPSSQPSAQPSSQPSQQPTIQPSNQPTSRPSVHVRRLDASDENEVMSASTTITKVGDRSYISYHVNTTQGVTFPVLFVIVQVDHGKVKSVAWDNVCEWCDTNRCVQNTVNYDTSLIGGIGPNCYLPDTDCYKFNNIGNVTSNQLCELTVYVSWEGTDVNGVNFGSMAYRVSRWSHTQLSNYTSTMEDKVIQI